MPAQGWLRRESGGTNTNLTVRPQKRGRHREQKLPITLSNPGRCVDSTSRAQDPNQMFNLRCSCSCCSNLPVASSALQHAPSVAGSAVAVRHTRGSPGPGSVGQAPRQGQAVVGSKRICPRRPCYHAPSLSSSSPPAFHRSMLKRVSGAPRHRRTAAGFSPANRVRVFFVALRRGSNNPRSRGRLLCHRRSGWGRARARRRKRSSPSAAGDEAGAGLIAAGGGVAVAVSVHAPPSLAAVAGHGADSHLLLHACAYSHRRTVTGRNLGT